MAKKGKSIMVEQSPLGKRWSPDRPMGLSRALNKAGWGTRPQTVEMVKGGDITVDGEIVVDPLFPVTPASKILLDGQELILGPKSYFAFHKPTRVVTGPGEAAGRKLVNEFFPSWIHGLQAAGRLDGRTTGLMLVSNDPAWNNSAASELKPEQEFRVQVEGELGEVELSVISASIHLPGMGIFRPLSVKVIETLNGRTVLHIVVKEGKIRQIRKMFSTLRHKITLLRRVRFGEIRLGDLAVGNVRSLTQKEIQFIKDGADSGPDGNPGADS
ncbi:MAG: hypothetical protein KOO60_04160 [Gemmatimonadales bacterium]|nr:hypothetical protein [Gemmatimonadales bacterium]